jgi:hypothetical protein
VLALLLSLSLACEKKITEIVVPNLRPSVELSVSPLPDDEVFYTVLFRWFAFDEDGEIDHFLYAVDPPEAGDTTWVRTRLKEISIVFSSSEPPDSLEAGGPVISSEYHVFVLKAVDNRGLESLPVFRAFTSFTTAPQSQIEVPRPIRLLAVPTPPTLVIRWSGSDPDGVETDFPVEYRVKAVSTVTIQDELGLGSQAPTAADIQEYFSLGAPDFTSWKSVPSDSTFLRLEGLTLGREYYVAVSAVDEAGAYEPRFLVGYNVLRFRPTTDLLAPVITVFNPFFSYTGPSGFVLDERYVGRLAFLSDTQLPFSWSAVPKAQGTTISGYRWVLDPIDGDLFDETPRESEEQTNRWSSWSLLETGTTLGPFTVEPGQVENHRFYVEARDDNGQVSIVVVEIRVVAASFERPLLVIDDFEGTPDRIVAGDPDNPSSYQPWGSFPTEAVLDTLLFAVGNVPYRYRPPGTLSDPGVFAGFDYDTLDYRFYRRNRSDVIGIDVLARYEAVVWYVGIEDAIRATGEIGEGWGPPAALNVISAPGALNSLGVYLSHGGKVWLFGRGVVRAVGQGEPVPEPPPGSFLYEFGKLRSQLEEAGRSFWDTDYLTAGTPYLPEYETPGRPWPPDEWTGERGEFDDPRVGPSAERHSDRWGNVPYLSLSTEFGNWPFPFPTKLDHVTYVSTPNHILEDLDGNPGTSQESSLDTLYLYRAKSYLLSSSPGNPDGKPVMVSYGGEEHGSFVICTLPLWFFERTQLRDLAGSVLGSFGFQRKPDRRTWTGPGSANERFGPVVQSPP